MPEGVNYGGDTSKSGDETCTRPEHTPREAAERLGGCPVRLAIEHDQGTVRLRLLGEARRFLQ